MNSKQCCVCGRCQIQTNDMSVGPLLYFRLTVIPEFLPSCGESEVQYLVRTVPSCTRQVTSFHACRVEGSNPSCSRSRARPKDPKRIEQKKILVLLLLHKMLLPSYSTYCYCLLYCGVCSVLIVIVTDCTYA